MRYFLLQIEKSHSKFPDFLLFTSHVFKYHSISWSVYMSVKSYGTERQTIVTAMLPIIDMHTTVPTALYSLLMFFEKQSQK